MIDAARAVHNALPETSARWAAVGLSQGGQAAWAANELNSSYGQGLELIASVSLSPPTDLAPLARTDEIRALQRHTDELRAKQSRHEYHQEQALQRIEEQVAESPEIQAVISQLEQRYDEAVEGAQPRSLLAGDADELPDADEIGAAAEAFLAQRSESDDL